MTEEDMLKPGTVFYDMMVRFQNCRYKGKDFKRVFGTDLERFLIKEPIPLGFDIIGFDSVIKERLGNYEEFGMSMNDVVRKTWGEEGIAIIMFLLDPPKYPLWHGHNREFFERGDGSIEEAQIVESTPIPKEQEFVGFDIGAAIAKKLSEG
jgi:hypothetical protein